jgi:hypothetical protein
MRNGKPAVKISPAEPKRRKLTAEQEAALARLLDPKNHFTSPPGWRFSKDDMWEDAEKERAEIKARWEAEAKANAKGRKRD